MFAALYLLLSYALGCALCRFFFPHLPRFAQRDFYGRPLPVSPLYLLLPAWLYFGVLPLTWAVYLLAVLFALLFPGYPLSRVHPLLPANILAAGAALALTCLLFRAAEKRDSGFPDADALPDADAFPDVDTLKSGKKWGPFEREWLDSVHAPEITVAALVAILVTFLMFRSFHVTDGSIVVGWSVFSDFTPHLSMIRSFSRGTNFPTVYTPFGGSDVKYHFLYQFLCGNLEFLGFRLDLAFNLPTIIGFLSTVSLLAVFAMKLSGRKGAGAIAAGLFLFRSSPSIWTFLAEQPKEGVADALAHTREFLGYTPNENWGLWNLNVYLNQRHLAFTLGVLILFVMLYTQVFLDGWQRLERFPTRGPGIVRYLRSWAECFTRESLFSPEGWKPRIPEDLETPVFGSYAVWVLPVLAVVINSFKLSGDITANPIGLNGASFKQLFANLSEVVNNSIVDGSADDVVPHLHSGQRVFPALLLRFYRGKQNNLWRCVVYLAADGACLPPDSVSLRCLRRKTAGIAGRVFRPVSLRLYHLSDD